MKISVFGLGYVGCVSAACFCDLGHEVWGIDVDASKVDFLKNGKSPIVEQDLPDLIDKYFRIGTLHGTTSAEEAVRNTELSLVCVGTPSLPSGALNIEYVQRVAEEIGAAMRTLNRSHTVVIRSTLLPGTTRRELLPRLEECSGKKEGDGFQLAYNPEFMREGTAVLDFYEPPKTVIGALREETAHDVSRIYSALKAPLFRTDIEVAEMVKYADNVFHAVKIVFGNEIGAVAHELGVDSHKVMDIFVRDTKLNLSPYYLKPGFAFGGSCLPKDVRAITSRAREVNVNIPMLFSVMDANAEHIRRAIKTILSFNKKRIGILGFAFKAGTDDLRESPMVELVEALLGKGCKIKILDRNVSLARLVGANRKYIESTIPHLAELMTDSADELLNHAEVLVAANKDPEFRSILERANNDQIIYDLVRTWPELPHERKNYFGICW
jgi:GDP-mannose 6-dehydrogenase